MSSVFYLCSISDPAGLVSLAPPVVHHVLGGGQPDDEEVQDDEEPGRLVRRLGEEGRLAEQWGVTGENKWWLDLMSLKASSG